MYGAFFSWFVIGPVLLVAYFHIPPQDFGWINLFLGGTAMALGGIFNGKVVGKLGQDTMLRLGLGLIILSGSMMLIFNFLYGYTLIPTLSCVFVFLFATTLIWPNAFAKAFAPFGSIAGFAGALYSFMQLGGGAFIGWISSFIPHNNLYALPLIFINTAFMAWMIFERVAKLPVKTC
jgi:DHA1 family bicyclomycin/chloramphenicol resistance-like MFS transporter/DHA1 family 2-module integral membrane pump EmrD-like MFS transporter